MQGTHEHDQQCFELLVLLERQVVEVEVQHSTEVLEAVVECSPQALLADEPLGPLADRPLQKHHQVSERGLRHLFLLQGEPMS